MSHRASPYPSTGAAVVAFQTPTAEEVLSNADTTNPTHTFVFLQGSWLNLVLLYSGPMQGSLIAGAIMWNNKLVPCFWSMTHDPTAATRQLYLRFHHDGDMTQLRNSCYTAILEHGQIRFWRSPQFGGQFLVQFS